MKSIEQPSDLLSSLFSAGDPESVAGAESPSVVSSGVAPVVGASVFAASASSSETPSIHSLSSSPHALQHSLFSQVSYLVPQNSIFIEKKLPPPKNFITI